MVFSSWLCTNSTRNMLVKIVHPGGHVELHDRPLLAAEIMLRNPRCCVTYPHVFKQPWAIVPPETMLMLGQKFYVVPTSTIRKLQKLTLRQSLSPSSEDVQVTNGEEVEEGKIRTCWLFVNHNTPKGSYTSLKQNKDGCVSSDDNCLLCLLSGMKLKPDGLDESKDDVQSTSTTESSSSSSSSSDTKKLARKRISRDYQGKKGIRGSPKRHASLDNWQPRLESITEENSLGEHH